MTNFVRACKLAGKYPATLLASVTTSLLIAVLWGGNIGAVYPVLTVVFEGQPLQVWIDESVARERAEIATLDRELTELRQQAAAAPANSDLTREIRRRETRLLAVTTVLNRDTRLQPWIHAWLPRDPFQTVVWIVGALMVATVIKDTCIVLNLMVVGRLINKIALELQGRFYEHVLKSDLHTFQSRGTSRLLNHISADVLTLSQGLNNLFGGAIREPLKMVACLAGASFICWRLLAFSLVLAPVAGLLIRSLAGSLKRAHRHALEHGQMLQRLVFESFNGIQTVQAYTMEDYETNRFLARNRDCMRKAMRIIWYGALSKPATEVLGLGVVSLALLAGAYLVLNQQTHLFGIKMSERPLSLESLLVFYGLLIGASDPARKMSEVFAAIQGGVAAADRFFPVIDEVPRIVPAASPQALARPHGKLEFDQVCFRYTPDQSVLRDICLSIPFGQTVAIVGPNGCGKSSLANLIPRFYDPVEGSVRIDGVDLRSLNLMDLRRRIGLVPQKAVLFDDTVRNNIRYGSPDATEEQIQEAARKAYAHQFIEEKLEQGYDTMVGQEGCRLSGGQRQRIALARAILRDPEILILDEATSQVDLESEQLIHRVLERFVRNRTAIIVTHRFSTLALADQIVVMDAGRILDIGRHEELFSRCELYGRLHEIQFRQSA